MPNNRQWATIMWVAALVMFLLVRKDLRSSVWKVLRIALSPKILIPLLVFVGWVIGLVAAASHVDLWGTARVTDTVFWFVTAGLVLFGSFSKISEEPRFVRRTAYATMRAGAFIEVFTEVFVLSLIAELFLLPFITILALLSAVATRDPEHHLVKRFVDWILMLVGFGVIGYVTINVIDGWGSLDKADVAQQFALPIWLTIGILPYIYLLGLLATYEVAFLRINLAKDRSRWARTRAKVALVTTFHVRALRLGGLSGAAQMRLTDSTSFRDAHGIIREEVEARQKANREALAAKQRLIDMAGVDGVDENGLRLDRREFETTTHALRWIGICHMGHHRNRGRYRADLLDFALDGLGGRDLPEPHGVEMRVSSDGQKWMAWRRTITGWVFAIGAAGPPPEQWEYDGPNPPNGFPGEDPAWGDRPFSSESSPNR